MTETASPQLGPLELALANGHQLLGTDPESAAEQAREILSKNEHDGDALRLLAKALRLLNRDKEAERVEVRAIESAAYDATLVGASRAILDGRLDEAERLVTAHLQQRPDDAAGVRLLAEVAGRTNHFFEAERLLRRAIDLAPAFTEARLRLATMFCFQNKVHESLVILDELLAFDPKSKAGLDAKAATLARIGDYHDAAVVYENMLARFPTYISGWISYGQMLNTIGEFEDSVAAYRQVIALDPHRGTGWWSLANLKSSRFTAKDIETMEAALLESESDGEEQVYLHFALGKALEDAGRYQESFNHYGQGNRIRANGADYRPEKTHDLVLRSEAIFTKQFFNERADTGAANASPIFVVGLPRAGSTLVEQILASHSSIEGTSELQYMALIQRRLARHLGNFPDDLPKLRYDQFREFGREYLENSKLHRKTKKSYFTDKLPNNWEHIGLILTVLPNCKIIDARRHPMACCFSTFKQLFSIGQEFTYSLDWLGRYYSDYVRMMDHFDRLYPGRILRVIHEELIDNPERQIRSLLDYIGVPFEESCLRFYENDRAVRTPSAEQVRRPINREGVNRWRSFEPWLGELKDALGPVLDAYPDVPPELNRS